MAAVAAESADEYQQRRWCCRRRRRCRLARSLAQGPTVVCAGAVAGASSLAPAASIAASAFACKRAASGGAQSQLAWAWLVAFTALTICNCERLHRSLSAPHRTALAMLLGHGDGDGGAAAASVLACTCPMAPLQPSRELLARELACSG